MKRKGASVAFNPLGASHIDAMTMAIASLFMRRGPR
jgi:hypothetical protein